ncbi:hypothetical protein [Rubripirellula reticaptiva]|uniref:Uncharacterized protein n=1 Tax=Rubripirellula reticaptiva TaxID=2528013 RepID=A0A5C6FBL5_9BACT|nr:hypothetical protein [Rubripirellula reticaptiva]TWU57970.1 hypothetical protein Poly59_08790 [Rubripirellula reticaptiva]
MAHVTRSVVAGLLFTFLGGTWLDTVVQAESIGWIERFALADDRQAAIDTLVPGTDDYFFYHCLHYQTTGQLEKAEAVLAEWAAKTPGPAIAAINAMVDRQRLLTYEQSPQRTIDHLVKRLGVKFDSAPPITRNQRRYASELNPSVLAAKGLIQQAIAEGGEFKPAALAFLADRFLRGETAGYTIPLSVLLGQIKTPSIPKLGELVSQELTSRRLADQRFGDLAAHKLLTLEELRALALKVPGVADDEAMVSAVLVRLRPSADVDLSFQPEARIEYLTRVETYVRDLPASYNSLKASAAFRLLEANLTRGKFDRELFLRYLKLPRNSPLVASKWNDANPHPADVRSDYMGMALLPPIGKEDDVLRAHLEHFLVDAESTSAFDAYLKPAYLRQVFAETKLLYGAADEARWYKMLASSRRQSLRDAVELRLSPTNPMFFDADAPTSLSVDLKNVDELIVRIYEINVPAYCRSHDGPLDTDIDLDGLVATHEIKQAFNQPAVRRHRQIIELPQITGRGVWVVDLIGNGVRGRAMIRRGSLDHVVTTVADGMAFTVIDENRKPVSGATVWMGSQTFKADADADVDAEGTILVPLASADTTRKVIISDGVLAESVTLLHPAETYELDAAMHLDRSILQSGGRTELLIRPRLSMTGVLVAPSMIDKAHVLIESTDLDGITSTQEVEKIELTQTGELVVPYSVPSRLASIVATLSGIVNPVTDAQAVAVSTSQTWNIAGIRKTRNIHDAFLTRDDNDYVIEVRGRNGEIVPGAVVGISINTIYRDQPVRQTLQAGPDGRVRLGELDGADQIEFSVSGGISHTHRLDDVQRFWPSEVFAAAGNPIELSWPEFSDILGQPSSRFRLVAADDRTVRTDETDHLSIRDGLLTITNLPPGDFSLIDRRTNELTAISIVGGPVIAGVAVGQTRHRSTNITKPISIANVQRDADGIKIKLSGETALARVHLYAKRYFDQASSGSMLHLPLPDLTGRSVSRIGAGYVGDLRLGDEYQYVLRRRYAAKFPGVMLPQPGLILNPWETDETQSQSQSAAEGEVSPPSAPARASRGLDKAKRQARQAAQAVASDFDFLADPGIVVANLRPDADGLVTIPADVIDGMPILRIVVCDPVTVIQTTVTGQLVDAETRDLRLAKTLDLGTDYSMEQSVLVASPDSPIDLQSLGSAQVQTIGSVASLLNLYKTLVSDSRLEDFDVLGHWSDLDEAAKLDAYSRLASHELHVFLWVHDRTFFDDVIAPYLTNKKEKQFVDHWLLGNDLSGFTNMWQYNRLNAAERAMLAMRVPDIREVVQRELRERVAIQDVDVAAVRFGIETALQQKLMESRSDMEVSDSMLGVEMDMAMGEPFGGSVNGGMGGGGAADPFGPNEFAFGGGQIQLRANAAKSLGRNVPGLPDANQWAALSRRRLGRSSTVFFRELDSTRQWAESHWDRVRTVSGPASESLIDANGFWSDLASGSAEKISVSADLLRPSDSRHAALMGLAFCGLPITAGEIDLPSAPDTWFKPAHGVAVVTKRLQRLSANGQPNSIMIGGRFTRVDDSDAAEVTEFVAGVVYRGQAVLSNPTPQQQSFNVLWQIPAGSIPVTGTKTLDSRVVTLKPFAVDAISYEFYFPVAGKFAHYPATAADGETLVAKTELKTFDVLDEATSGDTNNWNAIARDGSADKIATFLRDANVRKIDWSLVTHRMSDPLVYRAITDSLVANRLMVDELWAFSLKHNDEAGIQTFLSMQDGLSRDVGPVLDSSLLSVDPIERRRHEILEYSPLVRARIHRLGESDEILDPTFLAQYREFLNTVAYAREISPEQRLTLAYYLLIQNRIAESIAEFDKVDRTTVATKLQYDYMDAYLAMHRGEHARAEKIAVANAGHLIPRWAARFRELQSQLDQVHGWDTANEVVSKDAFDAGDKVIAEGSGDLAMIDRQTRQAVASDEMPELIVRVDGGSVRIDHRRTRSATLNLYGVDLELLFSKAPFVRDDLAKMAMVRPLRSESIDFKDTNGVANVDLDEGMRRQTLLVEVVSGVSRSTALSYGGNLTTYVSEAMGQLQVTDSRNGRPIGTTYVKVYAKYADGSVRFYKDGYSDARGRFDYASLSAADAKGATRFAILVLSDEQGATLHDVAPPRK